jgi:signal transduction histidine kinase
MVSKNYNKKEHPDNENEIIREINHTSQRLFDNAQNILNWVRYQNNLIKVQQVNVSPFVIAEETRELLLDVAAMRKNQIENLVEMDDIVYTDKTILSIIIQNIVSNAVKYTQNNTIQIKSSWNNNRYEMIIADQGPGISANNLYRIEAIKHKMKTSNFNESADGTGLGYVIIFELADLIKAEIDIESSPEGTIVSIVI